MDWLLRVQGAIENCLIGWSVYDPFWTENLYIIHEYCLCNFPLPLYNSVINSSKLFTANYLKECLLFYRINVEILPSDSYICALLFQPWHEGLHGPIEVSSSCKYSERSRPHNPMHHVRLRHCRSCMGNNDFTGILGWAYFHWLQIIITSRWQLVHLIVSKLDDILFIHLWVMQIVAAYMMIQALNKKGYNSFAISVPSAGEFLQIFGIAAPVFVTMFSKVSSGPCI